MYKFIVFDVDGVLLKIKSSWKAVHDALGSKESKEFMKKYFMGEATYEEWCFRDWEEWTKALGREPDLETLRKVFEPIEQYLAPGAKEAVQVSKRRGLGVGLLSAGLDLSTSLVAKALNVYLWMANPVGRECKPVVEPRDKGKALKEMFSNISVSLKEVIYVGDSIIDIPAFMKAGCSIGIRDEELKKWVDVWIKDLNSFEEALLQCINYLYPAKSKPYDEEYEYSYAEGDYLDRIWLSYFNRY